MCGIAGYFDPRGTGPDAEIRVRRMLSSIRHRGPDQFGIHLAPHAALGSARLSIVDVEQGQQPISNEQGTVWIVFNGEVFNHVELRAELESRGHRFTTRTDTETIVHLYEELGPRCLERLNGQFAIAIWDEERGTLFLARDRAGVRPLFYGSCNGALHFGSEIKAIFNGCDISRELEVSCIRDAFTFWGPLPGRSVFRNISELPPGCFLQAGPGGLSVERYWEAAFAPEEPGCIQGTSEVPLEETLERFETLMKDALRIRLRADVPVGAYLSGGLDSSTISAMAQRSGIPKLDTFSIAFSDTGFDESVHQVEMARFLGTRHQVVRVTHADIGRVFPEVVWHTEAPLLRTAPAPMFLLSQLAHNQGYKVVLTGEGADEFLAGYDIFKEAKIRRFWARHPSSRRRSSLIARLYPDVLEQHSSNASFLEAFFREGLEDVNAPDYSHAIRWRNNRRTLRFFEGEGTGAAGSALESIRPLLPPAFGSWPPLARDQFLEIALFLPQYLLSSQGDRVAMAHSVEGRFPFLDVRVMEFCNRLSPRLKMRALTEKYLLRKLAERYLPPAIAWRRKRPYRAPIHKSFFHPGQPDYVREMLSESAIRKVGLFKPAAVGQLVAKLSSGRGLGETDDMALAGILSTQLLHSQFVDGFRKAEPLGGNDNVKICRQSA